MRRYFTLWVLLLIGILVSCDEKKEAIEMLSVTPEQVVFGADGGTQTIEVKCSSEDWTWLSDLPDWVQIKKNNKYSVEITTLPNTERTPRETHITFSYKKLTQKVLIQQEANQTPYYLKPEKTSLKLDDEDYAKTMHIQTDAPDCTIAECSPWIETVLSEKDTETGNFHLWLYAKKNTNSTPRKGRIVLQADKTQSIIEIEQAEMAYVRLVGTAEPFHFFGGTQVIAYESNRPVQPFPDRDPDMMIAPMGDHQVMIRVFRNRKKELINRTIFFRHKEKDRVVGSISLRQERSDIVTFQREYLSLLFKATNGHQWKNNTNWLSDHPLSEWYGVKTESDGSIISLNLSDNNLKGKLPSGISALMSALHIKLAKNQLEGQLPYDLGTLIESVGIDLSNNNFTGGLPFSLCDKEENPRRRGWIDFRGNRLSGRVPQCLLEFMGRYNVCPQQEGYSFSNYDCKKK